MKQMITLMALMLIEKNGSTTNLDIKNALRKQFDDGTGNAFQIRQAEVHTAMNEIAQEQGLIFTLGYSQEGHEYRIWSKPAPVVDATDDLTDTDTDTTGNSDDDQLRNAAGSLTVNGDGSLTDSSSQPAATGTVPAGFGKQLDPLDGDFTAYWSKDNSVLMQGSDKNLVRKEMLATLKATHPTLKYDDIRVCSTAFYNKTVAGR